MLKYVSELPEMSCSFEGAQVFCDAFSQTITMNASAPG